MAFFRAKRSNSVEARVADIRTALHNQGHDLSALQEGMIRSVAQYDPSSNPSSKEMLEEIKQQISATGRWETEEGWRISTWFSSSIVAVDRAGKQLYTTTVSCDGEVLSCEGPSIERAYAFMRLYQKLILERFYTIGPGWSDLSPFES